MATIPNHWLLIARRNAGKSTFGAQMNPQYLVADLDGRWSEQSVDSASHVVKESDPLKLVEKMEALRPTLQGKVGTVIVDSGTAVMDFIQSRGRLQETAARAANQKFNLNDIHRMKADTMRLMRLAALKWHCDTLFIFHVEDSMESGNKKERTTISKLEMDRMKANLNAVLTIVEDPKGRRGIRIEWCRYNENVAAGQTIWDLETKWIGVPQKLSIFLQNYKGDEGYKGLAYSLEWLYSFLEGKGVKYDDVPAMCKALNIVEAPLWYDRSSWSKLIEQATAVPA